MKWELRLAGRKLVREAGVDVGHALDLPGSPARSGTGGHLVHLNPAFVNALAHGELALGAVN